MLTKEEFEAFMKLVMAFAAATELSPRQIAILFALNHPTVCRWFKAARTGDVVKAYRYVVDPVQAKVEKLNAYAAQYGGYAPLLELKLSDRVSVLRTAITAPAV